jgi:hypothetical protein
MTDLSAFRASLAGEAPPAALSAPLAALWWDAKGEWDRAHACAQDDPGSAGAAVHAYLHRKEGDLSNARYWYARAGRPAASGALAAEWEKLARELTGEKQR